MMTNKRTPPIPPSTPLSIDGENDGASRISSTNKRELGVLPSSTNTAAPCAIRNILNECRINYGSHGISDEYEEVLSSKLKALLLQAKPEKKDTSQWKPTLTTSDLNDLHQNTHGLAYANGYNAGADEYEAKIKELFQ